MLGLAEEIDTAIAEAVKGPRGHSYSWAEIGSRLGITRQAALQRWGATSWPSRGVSDRVEAAAVAHRSGVEGLTRALGRDAKQPSRRSKAFRSPD
jgi:hypothetical protein